MALISNGTTVISSGALDISAGDYVYITSFNGTNSYVQNCFSSAYENYVIRVQKFTTNDTLEMRLLTSGTTENTANNYNSSNVIYTGGYLLASNNYWRICSVASVQNGSWTINMNNPYQAVQTTYNGVGYVESNTASNRYVGKTGGQYNGTTSHTGFRIWTNNSSVLFGDVYGVKN
jgi:hypothetical protein